MSSPILRTENLTKKFHAKKSNEVIAIQDISLEIPKGECVLLTGSSGSGKSTLLAILSCLSKPTSGKYFCLDEPVSRWSEKFLTRFRRQHIGIVFQHFNLVKGLSVARNVSLPLLPQNLPFKEIKKAVLQATEQVNISHRIDFQIDKLSGGELQRTAIARALVNNPTLIFADEPTAHLDSENSTRILSLFQELKKAGKTLIITTHDPRVEQHSLADRKLILQDGKLTQDIILK